MEQQSMINPEDLKKDAVLLVTGERFTDIHGEGLHTHIQLDCQEKDIVILCVAALEFAAKYNLDTQVLNVFDSRKLNKAIQPVVKGSPEGLIS
jgi:hypothetical protein